MRAEPIVGRKTLHVTRLGRDVFCVRSADCKELGGGTRSGGQHRSRRRTPAPPQWRSGAGVGRWRAGRYTGRHTARPRPRTAGGVTAAPAISRVRRRASRGCAWRRWTGLAQCVKRCPRGELRFGVYAAVQGWLFTDARLPSTQPSAPTALPGQLARADATGPARRSRVGPAPHAGPTHRRSRRAARASAARRPGPRTDRPCSRSPCFARFVPTSAKSTSGLHRRFPLLASSEERDYPLTLPAVRPLTT